ncbi:MAG: hypothetical protein M3305_00400 [Actinomycetota bacterium]|nr:hypothetical protein [Actinomycetota bacterium]
MAEPTHQDLDASMVNELRGAATQRLGTVEFAGFLVREEDGALYVADPQGTWIIPRESIAFLEKWEQGAQCAPEYMRSVGRPVRIGIKDGATIHEIRPWQISKQPGGLGGGGFRQTVERVFTLGGSPLPIGERTMLGENQMAALERTFSRRLGWDPDDICNDPRAVERMMRRSAVSKTIVVNDGYTDVDDPF